MRYWDAMREIGAVARMPRGRDSVFDCDRLFTKAWGA